MSAAHTLALLEQSIGGSRAIEMKVDALVIAGWTGRDAESVQRHIRELQSIGVTPPRQTPMFYRIAAANLTTAARIEVAGRGSSGEVEVVLFAGESRLWVGLGSDHTDRELEKRSVTMSKQVCAKPIAPTVWPHEEVAAHWDSLELRSYASVAGERRLYQRGSVAALRDPSSLIQAYCGERRLASGTAMYCGTLAVHGAIGFAERMTLELHDPVLDRSITHEYFVLALPVED